MKRLVPIILALSMGLIGWLVWEKALRPKPVIAPLVSPSAPKKEWTPEEISKDPQAYLVWSDRQIQIQITERQKRMDSLSARRREIVERQQLLVEKVDEVTNFRARLQTAYQRSEDEDRWPVRMAGRTFERTKALEILEQTKIWLDDRKPLTDAYAASVRKMDDSETGLRNGIGDLERMREKMALDLERVRLNQGMAELDELRSSATQLASMSQALSQISDDRAPVLPTTSRSDHVDIDTILK